MKRKNYNENYFENINSEEKAYFLGLIFSDGAIVNDSKRYRYKLVLKLHERDQSILQKFIESIDGEMVIWKSKTRKMAEVGFSGKKIIKDLENLGLHQNKTFTLKYPKINQDLEKHFLRGYFDGDGCVRINKDKRDNIERGDLRIVGASLEMIEKINERMHYLFGTSLNKLYGPKNKEFIFIGWSAMTDIEKIYQGFYTGSCLYLSRKKFIFDRVIELVKNKKKYRKK
jgi:hypothetical protein